MTSKKLLIPVNMRFCSLNLKKYVFTDTELQWFISYLTDCKQFVAIKNSHSSFLNITRSILRPLLFLIYINDLPLSSSFLSLHFADDTTLLLSRHMITSKPLSRCVNFFVLTNLFSTWIKQNLFYSPVQMS